MSVRSDVGVCVKCGRVDVRDRLVALEGQHQYRCAKCPKPRAISHEDAPDLRAPRVLALFHAQWCPFSRAFLLAFERADAESSVPAARVDLSHPMDPRWDEQRVLVVPTVLYLEHGEELERVEAVRGVGMNARAFERFMEDVEALQERLVKRHGRLQVDRFG